MFIKPKGKLSKNTFTSNFCLIHTRNETYAFNRNPCEHIVKKVFPSFQRTPSLRRKWRKRYGGLDGNKLLEPNKEDDTRGTKTKHCNCESFRCNLWGQIPSITTLRHWSHISSIQENSKIRVTELLKLGQMNGTVL